MNDTLNDVTKYLYANNCNISREQLSKDVKFMLLLDLIMCICLQITKKLRYYSGMSYEVLMRVGKIIVLITFTGDGAGGTYWSIAKANITKLTKP